MTMDAGPRTPQQSSRRYRLQVMAAAIRESSDRANVGRVDALWAEIEQSGAPTDAQERRMRQLADDAGVALGDDPGLPRWATLVIVALPIISLLILAALVLERRQRAKALKRQDFAALEEAD